MKCIFAIVEGLETENLDDTDCHTDGGVLEFIELGRHGLLMLLGKKLWFDGSVQWKKKLCPIFLILDDAPLVGLVKLMPKFYAEYHVGINTTEI